MEKKVLFFGKRLYISEINFNKTPFWQEVGESLNTFLNPEPDYEIQTSGSTGDPKKIKIRKSHMRASAQKTIEALSLKQGMRTLLCLSPKRIGGMMMLVRWLEGDLDLYLSEPVHDPLSALQHQVDFTALVPYQLAHSLEGLYKVKTAIIGGGGVNRKLEEATQKSSTRLYHTYGMTETISHVALRPFGEADYFKAVPGARFSLDARKCLVIDAPYMGINGLVTNDMVQLIDRERFTWLGRYDNVVNSGGIKLHPETLEEKIGDLGFPYFLTGMPDALLGEKLVLICGAKEALSKEEEVNLLERLKGVLGKYEKPKNVFTVPELLFTENGKLRRALSLYTPTPAV